MHTSNQVTSSTLHICNICLHLGLRTSYPVFWSWNDPSFPLQESLSYTSRLSSTLCLVHEITQCDSAQLTSLSLNTHQIVCTLHRHFKLGLSWRVSWKRTFAGQEITRRWVPWAISICIGWRETKSDWKQSQTRKMCVDSKGGKQKNKFSGLQPREYTRIKQGVRYRSSWKFQRPSADGKKLCLGIPLEVIATKWVLSKLG